jgi:exodeoxyribonuclease VII small subunit
MTDPATEEQTVGEELSFEEALARLEEIVEQLESGQMPLEEALQRFEEGVRLRAACIERLEKAETRIEQVLAETAELADTTDTAPEPEDDGA